MKRILLILLLLPMLMTAQSISIGFDPAVAIGTTDVPSYPAMDIQLRVNINNTLKNEYGVFVEAFPEIDYYQWGLFYQYAVFNTNHCRTTPKFQLFGGVELSQLFKVGENSTTYMISYGANIVPRYNLGKFFIELQCNLELRSEWNKYVYSNYINIGINI